MSATQTIDRLRQEVRKLRTEHPDVALLYDENQLLRKAVEEYQRREASLQGAIAKALARPARTGVAITEGTPPSGAGTWRPSGQVTPAMKARRDARLVEAEELAKTRRELRARRIDR